MLRKCQCCLPSETQGLEGMWTEHTHTGSCAATAPGHPEGADGAWLVCMAWWRGEARKAPWDPGKPAGTQVRQEPRRAGPWEAERHSRAHVFALNRSV